MSQNLTCKATEKFTVYKVKKAAVQANKEVKTDDGKNKVVADEIVEANKVETIDSQVNQDNS